MSKLHPAQTISMIAAVGKGRAIGKDNELLWRIPDDLRHFKEITTDHSVIMGKNTFNSIGQALPRRKNIVLTREQNDVFPGAVAAHSFEEAYALAGDGEVFVIGGAEVYKHALPDVDRLYLTLIDEEKDADAFFPDYSQFTKIVSKEDRVYQGIRYSFVVLEKED